jgi:hypothetical protein
LLPLEGEAAASPAYTAAGLADSIGRCILAGKLVGGNSIVYNARFHGYLFFY